MVFLCVLVINPGITTQDTFSFILASILSMPIQYNKVISTSRYYSFLFLYFSFSVKTLLDMVTYLNKTKVIHAYIYLFSSLFPIPLNLQSQTYPQIFLFLCAPDFSITLAQNLEKFKSYTHLQYSHSSSHCLSLSSIMMITLSYISSLNCMGFSVLSASYLPKPLTPLQVNSTPFLLIEILHTL